METLQEGLAPVFSLSSDLLIAIILAILAGLFVYLKGKRRGVALLFAFYPAILIFEHFPFLKSGGAWMELALFSALLFALFLIIQPFVLAESSFSKIKRIAESLLVGTLIAGFFLLAAHQAVDIREIYSFSNEIARFFTSGAYFWWLVTPWVLFFFIKR